MHRPWGVYMDKYGTPTLFLKLKLQTLYFTQTKITYRSYMYHCLSLIRPAIFKLQGKILQGKICEKCKKISSAWDG